MNEDAQRPSPEALLRRAQKEGRGKLKVFLGAAPGVGKTYAMLRAAHRALADGVDVCVGLVETHGRSETAAMAAGLELLPRRVVDYRGRAFEELDVEAIIRRKPRLVLVDELAHTNIPGVSHDKRYQDIDDLLSAGIDVYTTLNVQHLESLNDVVAHVTGVAVRETVPDEVLDRADDIELIDLPPEDLIRRLREGKVYVPEQARLALNQFFGRGALTALRELALRTAAEHIDAQMLEFKQAHAVTDPWPTRERLLVCINEMSISQPVIRAARRLAEHRRLSWIAVHVETPRALSLPAAARDRIARNLRLAERLGAETLTVSGDDLVKALIDTARSRNCSQIVVGRSQSRRLSWLPRWPWKRSVAVELISRAAPLEVTVVTWVAPERSADSGDAAFDWTPPQLKPYLWAMLAGAAAALVCLPLARVIGEDSLGMVFLLAVLGTAIRRGLWPSIFCALLCSVLYNLLFTEPRYTLLVSNSQDAAALLAFLAVALLAGNVGGRMRAQLQALNASTRQARELADFAQRLAAAGEVREVVRAFADHVEGTLGIEAVLMLPGETEAAKTLLVIPGSSNRRPLEPIDHAAAKWAWERDEAAGRGTETLPAASWLFVALTTAQGRLGVVGVQVSALGRTLDTAERRLLESVADLTALAVERTQLASSLEESRVLTETEQLRAALLSSVSHDLRTPLVSVLGAADALLQQGAELSAAHRRELAESIVDEAERLNRFVQNLLDMTRLSYGRLSPRLDWCDLGELIASARQRLRRSFTERRLEVKIDAGLPLLRADPVLLEQVLVNLLDNAVKYSPPQSAIRIRARREGMEALIDVEDEGPGIEPSNREQVFDMFYRARASDQRTAGTGLGLAICRGLMQAHGGDVAALDGSDRNGAGTGACLRLRLPIPSDTPVAA